MLFFSFIKLVTCFLNVWISDNRLPRYSAFRAWISRAPWRLFVVQAVSNRTHSSRTSSLVTAYLSSSKSSPVIRGSKRSISLIQAAILARRIFSCTLCFSEDDKPVVSGYSCGRVTLVYVLSSLALRGSQSSVEAVDELVYLRGL